MSSRFAKSLPLLLLCAIGAGAQTSSILPNAPHVVAADLSAAIPVPPTVTRGMTMAPVLPMTPAMIAVTEPRPAVRPKVFDRKFIALGIAVFGLTAMDVEFTQHCLHRGTCRELDPTLPKSRWGMYAVNTPTNLAVMYLTHRRRAGGKRGWWLAPALDIGAHVVGVGSNIRFLGK